MNTHIPALDVLLEEPQDGSKMANAAIRLSVVDADAILGQMSFERQRDADLQHIGMLADMFRNGEWVEGSQLTFTLDQFGNPKLVDGQHRLRAAIQAGWEGVWTARVLFKNDSAASMYTLLDAHQKKRPPHVIGRALGFGEFSVRMQSAMISAARYQNQWRSEYILPDGCYTPPVRDNIARATERREAFAAADKILGGANVSAPAARKLLGAMVLAVVVETLVGDEADKATEFWQAVSTNGGGIAGELRDHLLEGPPRKAGKLFIPRLVANAWNQRNAEKLKKSTSNKAVVPETTTLEIPA